MTFRTQYNYDYAEAKNFEHPYGKSLTVPNQVLTPAEMLDRFTRGLPLSTSVLTPYYSDEELPDIAKMDLSERFEIARENAEVIAEAKISSEKAKKKAENDLIKKQAREELLKEQETPPLPPNPKTPAP